MFTWIAKKLFGTSNERYLRRVKRPRAEKILARLLKADSDLKGGSPLSDRLQMELLLLWLAGAETR